jgi:hypothetical protein
MVDPNPPDTKIAPHENIQSKSDLTHIQDEETTVSDQSKSITRSLSGVFDDAPLIIRHTITLMLALLSIWVLHLLLEYLLGKDAKFFDWIPIRYVFEAADLVMILKFLWHLIRGFNK